MYAMMGFARNPQCYVHIHISFHSAYLRREIEYFYITPVLGANTHTVCSLAYHVSFIIICKGVIHIPSVEFTALNVPYNRGVIVAHIRMEMNRVSLIAHVGMGNDIHNWRCNLNLYPCIRSLIVLTDRHDRIISAPRICVLHFLSSRCVSVSEVPCIIILSVKSYIHPVNCVIEHRIYGLWKHRNIYEIRNGG